MRFHTVVAVLTATLFVAGCSFTPKKPPTPDTTRRVPINLAAPYPKPWPPSKLLAMQQQQPAPETVADISPPSSPTIGTQQAQGSTPIETTKPSIVDLPQKPQTESTLLASVNFELGHDDESTNKAAESIAPLVAGDLVSSDATKTKLEASELSLNLNPPTPTDALEPEVHGDKVFTKKTSTPEEPANSFPVELASTGTSFPLDLNTASKDVDQGDAAENLEPLNAKPTELMVVPGTESSPSVSTQEPPLQEDGTEAPVMATDPDIFTRESPLDFTPSQKLVAWTAVPGTTLSDLVHEWAEKEQWMIRWESTTDFVIDAPFSLEAPDFLAAANLIFKSFRDAGCQFNPTAYSNKVLVIETPKECKQ